MKINDVRPLAFYSLRNDLDKLEEFYYRVFDYESRLVDHLWTHPDPEMHSYIVDLVHEGRASAHTAISTLDNLKWYEKEKPDMVQESRKKMCHYFYLFSIYMRTLILLDYNYGEIK